MYLMSNNYNSDNLYTFVHIPKTGGLSIKSTILKYNLPVNDDVSIKNCKHYLSHHTTLCSIDNNPIIVVREPLDRFKSLYFYWKQVSLQFAINNHDTDNHYEISDFISILKNHELLISNRRIWNSHLQTQTFYINNCPFENIIVIKYEKDKIVEKFKTLFNDTCYGNIPNKIIHTTEYNDHDFKLTNEQYKFIYEYFKEDFKLYETLQKSPEVFKKVL